MGRWLDDARRTVCAPNWLWKSPRSLAKRDLSQWLLENYRCGARRPRGRVHTVSSDQDHRRGESLGKPILINPFPLVGAVERLVLALSPSSPVGELSVSRAVPRP